MPRPQQDLQTLSVSQSVSLFKLCARIAYPLSQALGLRLTSSQRNKRNRRTRHSTSSNRLYKTLNSIGAGVVGSSWRCRARSRIYKPYQSVSLFKLCARIAYPLSARRGRIRDADA